MQTFRDAPTWNNIKQHAYELFWLFQRKNIFQATKLWHQR